MIDAHKLVSVDDIYKLVENKPHYTSDMIFEDLFIFNDINFSNKEAMAIIELIEEIRDSIKW